MKYRVLDPNLTAVSRGEFCARVEDGLIDLPEDLARDFLAAGLIAPEGEKINQTEIAEDDGLRQPERRQSRARK